MDPNTQNPNPPTPDQTAPTQPTSSLQPEAPQSPGVVSQQEVPKRSRTKRLIVIFGVVLLLVPLAYVVFATLVNLQKAAQARSVSTAFMVAMTKQDNELAYELAGATDESTKNFLKASSEDVAGTFDNLEDTKQDNKFYFSYSLTNDTNKYARTILEAKDGKFYVSSFVFGPNPLSLVPAESVEEEVTSKKESSQSSQQTACLAKSDVESLLGSEAYFNDIEDGTVRRYIVATYFFKPDSTAYNYPDVMTTKLQKVKEFYATNKDKQFTITISGKAKEASASSVGARLALDRAEKVKADFVAQGVAADRIVIVDSQTGSASYDDGSERNVDIRIDVNLPC